MTRVYYRQERLLL